MTTTRQELESKIATFAAAQVPPVVVAYEGVPFTRPVGVPWMECFVKTGPVLLSAVSGESVRTRGTWAVNCYYPSGQGTGKLETLAQGVVNTFKVLPKVGSVSIEQPGNTGNISVTNDGWICIPISFPFRVESLA